MQAGENYIVKYFIISTRQQTLLEWWCRGGWDGRCM